MPRIASPATIIASLALLIALGGTSYATISAALPPNSVGTAQLKNNAVISSKVKNGALLAADFAPGQLPTGGAGPAGPAGPTGPAGPSDAYSRFVNGPVAVPGSTTTLASLSIPQGGKYVIWAKAYFTTPGPIVATVTCTTEAGSDYDQSVVYGHNDAVENNVVHEFGSSGGSVDFRCSGTSVTAQARFIKITAIRVGNFVNSG